MIPPTFTDAQKSLLNGLEQIIESRKKSGQASSRFILHATEEVAITTARQQVFDHLQTSGYTVNRQGTSDDGRWHVFTLTWSDASAANH